MPFEAMAHGCGWRVGGGRATTTADVASREQAEAHLERIRAQLARPRADPIVGKYREVEFKPVTEGHGALCTCEVCWPKRMRANRQKEGDNANS
jgi:hypothetical protein